MLPPRGYFTRSGDVSGCHFQREARLAYGRQSPRPLLKILQVQTGPTTQGDLAPEVSSAEADKH